MSRTRIAASAFAAAGLALGAATCAAAACQLQTIAELPVTLQNGSPLVDVSLNGRSVRFLLDTGSGATLLSRPSAEELGLSPVPLRGVSFYGVGGGDEASTVRIRELRLGAMVGRDYEVIVSGRLKPRNFVGLLGRDVLFARGDVEFDLANHMVRVFQPKGCQGDEVVYWNKPYSVATIASVNGSTSVNVNATLNGKRVFALLDTGATRSVVTLAAARQAGVTPRSHGVEPADGFSGMNGAVQSWVGTFGSLSVGDETVRNAELRLADLFSKDQEVLLGSRIPKDAIDAPAMLLGADFVRSHRIYIARSQGRIYFSYNGGPIFETPGQADAPAAAKP